MPDPPSVSFVCGTLSGATLPMMCGTGPGIDSSSLELSESDEPVLSFELWRIC